MDCIRPETITLRSVECELARPRDISLEFFLVSVVSGIEIRVEGEKTWMAILPAVPTVNSIRLARGGESVDVRRHGGRPQTDLVDSHWAGSVLSH